MNVAEGAIRSGKTIDHCIIAAMYLEKCSDAIHLASGSTLGNAKLNIGVCNGFGLEALFRGRCHWGKFKDNEALFIDTQTGEKIVIFVGGGKADSYKRILGNSYGLWIATEINEHFDSDDSRTSFIKVAMGRQAAARAPLILWDLNPCPPKHRIYTDYIDKYKEGFVGGYQYQHFTLTDNMSISEQRKAEIASQYDPHSVWYKRDILGQRVAAEGLIYRLFADMEDWYAIDRKSVPKLRYIEVGADIGGTKSNHAFVANGFDEDFDTLYVLKAKSIKADGVSVSQFINEFVKFVDAVIADYGFVDTCWPDCAEAAILNELDAKTKYRIRGSIKGEINDRIRCADILFTAGRIKLVKGECEDLAAGLRSAVWDPDEIEDIRLDDGTSDIDILDAWEYGFTPHMRRFVYFDPPYLGKGDRLYKNALTVDDHKEIAEMIKRLSLDWIVTYDNVSLIRELYQDYTIKDVELRYCVASKRNDSEIMILKSPQLITPDA